MIAMHDFHLLEGSLSDCHCRPVDGQAVVDLCLDVYRCQVSSDKSLHRSGARETYQE